MRRKYRFELAARDCALTALLVLVMSAAGCELFNDILGLNLGKRNLGTKVRVTNEGRDPIHMGGEKLLIGDRYQFELRHGDSASYELSRSGSSLGTLTITDIVDVKDTSVLTVWLSLAETTYNHPYVKNEYKEVVNATIRP
jgi:hypothetical protein